MATALQLRSHTKSLSIIVVEASDYSGSRIGESVAPGLEPILQALSATQVLNERQHLPSAGVQSCWGSEDAHSNDFLLYPRGRGWHLDRAAFDGDLATLARERDIEVCTGFRFNQVCFNTSNSKQRTFGQGKWQLGFAAVLKESASVKEFAITATFAVDASGRAAKFARQQGSQALNVDSLISIYSYCESGAAEKPFATIQAFEDGWWYSAPLPNNKKIIALMTDSDIASKKGYKQQRVWLEVLREVNNANGALDSTVLADTSLRCWPAYSSINQTINGEQWLAVGDAAMCYDPLSSQGITKSMVHGIYAAHAINDWFKCGCNTAGATQALTTYTKSCTVGFQHYYSKWCEYYYQEQRWPSSDFWRRRQFNLAGFHPNNMLSLGSQTNASRWQGVAQWQQIDITNALTANAGQPLWHVVNRLKSAWQQQGRVHLPDEYIINTLLALVRSGVLNCSVNAEPAIAKPENTVSKTMDTVVRSA